MAQDSFSLLYPQYDNRLLDSSYEWQTPEPSLAEIKAKELLEASKQKEEALAKRNKDAWAQPDDGSLEYAVKQAFGALTSSAGTMTGNIFTALGDVEPNALRNLLGPDDMNQYKAREEAKVKLTQLNDQLPKVDPITRQALIQQQQVLQQQVAQANSYLNRPIPKDKLGWYEKLITDPNDTGTVGDVARAYWLKSNNALSQYGSDVVNTGLNKVYRGEGADQVEARSAQYGEKASDAWSDGSYGKAALISVQGALDNLISNPGTAATMALESTFQTLSATNPVAAAATYGPIFLNAKTQGFTDFEKAHNGRAPNDEEKAIITGAAVVIATSDLAGDFLLTKVLPGFNKLLKKNPGVLSDPMKAELVTSFARTKALAKGVGSAALAVPSEELQGGFQNLSAQYAGIQDFNKVDTATVFAEGIKEGTAAGAMGATSTLGIPGDVSKANRDNKTLQQATKAIEAFKQSEAYATMPKATDTFVEAYIAFEKTPTPETLANAVSSIVNNPHHNLPEIAKRVQEVATKAGMELSEPINILLNDIQIKPTSTIGNLTNKAIDSVNKVTTTVRSFGTDAMLSDEGIEKAPMAAIDTLSSKVGKTTVNNDEELLALRQDTTAVINKIQLSLIRDLIKRKGLTKDNVRDDKEYDQFKIKALTTIDQLTTIEEQYRVPDINTAIESISIATSEQRTTDTTLGSSINIVLGSMSIGKPNKITDDQLDKLVASTALQEDEKEFVRLYKEVRSKNIDDVSQDIANSAPGFKGINSYLEDLNLAIASKEEKQTKAILNNLQSWVAKFGKKRNDVEEAFAQAVKEQFTRANAILVPKIKEGENYEIHRGSTKLIEAIREDYKLLQLAQMQAGIAYNLAFSKQEAINPKVKTTEVKQEAKENLKQATEVPTETSQKPSEAVKPTEVGKDTTEPTKTQEEASTATQEEAVTQLVNIPQIVNAQDLVTKLKQRVTLAAFTDAFNTLMEKFNNYLKNPRSNIKINTPKTAIILPTSIDPYIDSKFDSFKAGLTEHFSTLSNYEVDIEDDPILHLLAIEGNKVSLPEYIVNAMAISGYSYLVTQASGLVYTNERALKRMFGYSNDDRLNWEAWSFAFMGKNRNSVIETLGKEAYRLSGIRVADEIDRKRMQSAMGTHILYELKKIKIGNTPIFKENAVSVEYYRKAFKEFGEADTLGEAEVHFISLNRNPDDEFEVLTSVAKLLKAFKDKHIAKKFIDAFDLSFKEIKPLTKPSTYVPEFLVGTKQKLSDIAQEAIKAVNGRAYTLNKDEFTIIKQLFDDPDTKPLLLKQLGYLDPATQHIEIRRGVETKNRVIERDLYALFDYVNQLETPETEVYFEHDVWRNQRIGLSSDSGISPQGSKFIRSLISLDSFTTEITSTNLDRFKIAVMGGFGLEFGKVPLNKFYDEFDALANDEALNKLTKEDYAGIFKYLVDKEVEDLTHGLVSVINYLNYKEANGNPFKSRAFIEIDGKSNGPGWGIIQTQSVDKEFQYAVGVFDLVDETDFVNEVDNKKHSGAYEMIAIAWDAKLSKLTNSELFPIQSKYIKSLTKIEDTIIKATGEGRNVSKPPFMKLVFGQSETSMVRDLGNTLFYLMIDAITNAKNQAELDEVLADINFIYNTTKLEIKYEDRLDTPIDDEIKQRIILSVDSTYGNTLKEIVNERFENFKRTRDAVNAMGAFISNVFIEALQVKIYEAESKGRILTSEEIDELMYGELLPLLPAINTPNSNGDIRAGLLLLKPIVTRPPSVQVKVSYRLVNVDGKSVGANQYTLYKQEQQNRKKKLVSTEKRGQSMQGNILQRSFEDAGVGSFISGIHSSDGSQMQRVMTKLDAFGVHDAIYLGVDNLFEGGKLMNQVFAEINEEYSLAQAMLDRYDEIIIHLRANPLGTHYGLSEKQLANINEILANIKEHNVGTRKIPNKVNQRNILKEAVAKKNEFFEQPHNWHQFPMSTAHWISGNFTNETKAVPLDESVVEQELNTQEESIIVNNSVENSKATPSKYSNVESTEQENQDALKAIKCIKGNK